ncbi:hypothetical protein D3C71_23170 [compost metagenome]
MNVPDYEVEVSGDGSTVWVNAHDGSCIGRFSKRFGIDLHTTATQQLEGASQCLYCTHGTAGPQAWQDFRERMQAHYGINVAADLIEFP